jgi:hypothetical protein
MKLSKLSRRKFLKSLIVSGNLIQGVACAQKTTDSTRKELPFNSSLATQTKRQKKMGSIDRKALVRRHNPVIKKLDPLSPLSLGNGEFAFTGDVTGLQTFPEEYEQTMPLCTMSQWGWHTAQMPQSLDHKTLRLAQYDTHGRQVGYPTSSDGQTELYNWLRANPHRLHLGRIGLHLTAISGSKVQAKDLNDIEQKLDLWSGILTSLFKLEDKQVVVKTAVHPNKDLLAVTIESKLIDEGRLAVRFAFPYGLPAAAQIASWDKYISAADWQQPDKHESVITKRTKEQVEIRRALDDNRYFVSIGWSRSASFSTERDHVFLLTPTDKNSRMEFIAAFSANHPTKDLPSAAATFAESAEHWSRFWTRGGAIELAESRDSRAPELERRIVLSQYLTVTQCAGSRPPQETGLTVNSWYGKFHLEMHWWHAAHFALWNRLPLLEKSLGWYNSILPAAEGLAKAQGYAGARWPKMVGPDGKDSPSPIGPLLIWQQPHPIFYAELCYKTNRNRATLERYRSVVFETAEFMASFAFFDRKTQRYALGPPVIPAQENHPPRETWNPTFELAYWSYGLKVAQQWRERLGMKRNAHWDQIILNLSPLPARDGVYLAHENCPQTFTERNRDHPSMLGALGMLPGDEVDRETMRRTLYKVMKEWRWDETWGWDYPLTAMTAARLGETKIAVDALLMPTEKNRYLPNGHNWQRPSLPCYLPGNGGLLYAVAIMAAGRQGAPSTNSPGFPSDGSWKVRWENLNSSLLKEI